MVRRWGSKKLTFMENLRNYNKKHKRNKRQETGAGVRNHAVEKTKSDDMKRTPPPPPPLPPPLVDKIPMAPTPPKDGPQAHHYLAYIKELLDAGIVPCDERK